MMNCQRNQNIPYEVIDFHTHPFTEEYNNICCHTEYCDMSIENTKTYLESLGISKICGSVLNWNRYPDHSPYQNPWEMVRTSNETALALKERYGDFYIPGFHVHPDYVRESCDEIERMSKLGIRLIGELCPYLHGWEDFSCKEFDEILDVAEAYHMVVNIHSSGADTIDAMLKKHPKTVIVAAHPDDTRSYLRHLERMKISGNYYLDLSASGLFRNGMLRHGIDEFGAERFLFGSDWPSCNAAMVMGGILLDTMITEREKELILAGNAKRLLGL